MHQACPEEFPLTSFYFFGWSGKLDFKARKQEAVRLYDELKKLDGAITIIAHSHGGNVALHLAEVAQARNDTDFQIDRLILLATPVQEATAGFTAWPLFKKVIACYSATDATQILDPQGCYSSAYKNRKGDKKSPLFSRRTFEPIAGVRQARILLDKHDPGILILFAQSS